MYAKFDGGDGPAVLLELGFGGSPRPQLCVSHMPTLSGPCQMTAYFCEWFPYGGLRWYSAASSSALCFSSSDISSSILDRCKKLRATDPEGWQVWPEEPYMCHFMAIDGSSEWMSSWRRSSSVICGSPMAMYSSSSSARTSVPFLGCSSGILTMSCTAMPLPPIGYFSGMMSMASTQRYSFRKTTMPSSAYGARAASSVSSSLSSGHELSKMMAASTPRRRWYSI
mmetsp:Transcript_81088/g.196812  ORF Transcript_81088/g.196812 Transcript_81088/m.196812 type:complete len:225 (+) Transcript_81088:239-913(+)